MSHNYNTRRKVLCRKRLFGPNNVAPNPQVEPTPNTLILTDDEHRMINNNNNINNNNTSKSSNIWVRDETTTGSITITEITEEQRDLLGTGGITDVAVSPIIVEDTPLLTSGSLDIGTRGSSIKLAGLERPLVATNNPFLADRRSQAFKNQSTHRKEVVHNKRRDVGDRVVVLSCDEQIPIHDLESDGYITPPQSPPSTVPPPMINRCRRLKRHDSYGNLITVEIPESRGASPNILSQSSTDDDDGVIVSENSPIRIKLGDHYEQVDVGDVDEAGNLKDFVVPDSSQEKDEEDHKSPLEVKLEQCLAAKRTTSEETDEFDVRQHIIDLIDKGFVEFVEAVVQMNDARWNVDSIIKETEQTHNDKFVITARLYIHEVFSESEYYKKRIGAWVNSACDRLHVGMASLGRCTVIKKPPESRPDQKIKCSVCHKAEFCTYLIVNNLDPEDTMEAGSQCANMCKRLCKLFKEVTEAVMRARTEYTNDSQETPGSDYGPSHRKHSTSQHRPKDVPRAGVMGERVDADTVILKLEPETVRTLATILDKLDRVVMNIEGRDIDNIV
jgi:hypothetical protein